MDPEEMEYEGEDWIHVAQDRNQLRAPVNKVVSILGIYSLAIMSFSTKAELPVV